MSLNVEVHPEDERGNVFKLREELQWGGITVPVGFESDGASVPRFFWRLIFPPVDPQALRAAILHDWIYRTHPDGWSRAAADNLFFRGLVADGIPTWRAKLAYWGVRLFGERSWE